MPNCAVIYCCMPTMWNDDYVSEATAMIGMVFDMIIMYYINLIIKVGL